MAPTLSQLHSASRKELQALCKGTEIKANQKTDILLSSLIKLHGLSSAADSSPAPAPAPVAVKKATAPSKPATTTTTKSKRQPVKPPPAAPTTSADEDEDEDDDDDDEMRMGTPKKKVPWQEQQAMIRQSFTANNSSNNAARLSGGAPVPALSTVTLESRGSGTSPATKDKLQSLSREVATLRHTVDKTEAQARENTAALGAASAALRADVLALVDARLASFRAELSGDIKDMSFHLAGLSADVNALKSTAAATAAAAAAAAASEHHYDAAGAADHSRSIVADDALEQAQMSLNAKFETELAKLRAEMLDKLNKVTNATSFAPAQPKAPTRQLAAPLTSVVVVEEKEQPIQIEQEANDNDSTPAAARRSSPRKSIASALPPHMTNKSAKPKTPARGATASTPRSMSSRSAKKGAKSPVPEPQPELELELEGEGRVQLEKDEEQVELEPAQQLEEEAISPASSPMRQSLGKHMRDSNASELNASLMLAQSPSRNSPVDTPARKRARYSTSAGQAPQSADESVVPTDDEEEEELPPPVTSLNDESVVTEEGDSSYSVAVEAQDHHDAGVLIEERTEEDVDVSQESVDASPAAGRSGFFSSLAGFASRRTSSNLAPPTSSTPAPPSARKASMPLASLPFPLVAEPVDAPRSKLMFGTPQATHSPFTDASNAPRTAPVSRVLAPSTAASKHQRSIAAAPTPQASKTLWGTERERETRFRDSFSNNAPTLMADEELETPARPSSRSSWWGGFGSGK